MPAKKSKNSKAAETPRRTPKRKTAIPVAARAKRAVRPVEMRLVMSPPVEPVQPAHEMIARRAFEIWQNYLRLANDPVRHWLEAEGQLFHELNGSGNSVPSSA